MNMQYTLFTKSGKTMQFYVKSVAELYKQIYGGYIVSDDILVDKTQLGTVYQTPEAAKKVILSY